MATASDTDEQANEGVQETPDGHLTGGITRRNALKAGVAVSSGLAVGGTAIGTAGATNPPNGVTENIVPVHHFVRAEGANDGSENVFRPSANGQAQLTAIDRPDTWPNGPAAGTGRKSEKCLLEEFEVHFVGGFHLDDETQGIRYTSRGFENGTRQYPRRGDPTTRAITMAPDEEGVVIIETEAGVAIFPKEGPGADTEPTEGREEELVEEQPPNDRFDRSGARDAGGPPQEMIEPTDQRPAEDQPEASEAWPGTEERPAEGIYSGGAFQQPNQDKR